MDENSFCTVLRVVLHTVKFNQPGEQSSVLRIARVEIA